MKNKMAPPFKIAEFDIRFDQGIAKRSELLRLGVEFKVLEKLGSWFSYHGERIGQGRENVYQYLAGHPDVCRELEETVRAKLFGTNTKCPRIKS